MKEGFTFNKVSLMFLRKVIFKNFGGGGENRKEPFFRDFLIEIDSKTAIQKRLASSVLAMPNMSENIILENEFSPRNTRKA